MTREEVRTVLAFLAAFFRKWGIDDYPARTFGKLAKQAAEQSSGDPLQPLADFVAKHGNRAELAIVGVKSKRRTAAAADEPATEPEPEPEKKPEPKPEPPREMSLKDFGAAVNASADDVRKENSSWAWSPTKALIIDVYAAAKKRYPSTIGPMDLPTFKTKLKAAHKDGVIQLARADFVAMFINVLGSDEKLKQSEAIFSSGAEVHLVLREGKR